jgi:VanZ family protein
MRSLNRSFYIRLSAIIVWMLVIYFKSGQSYQEQDLRPLFAKYISQTTLQQWLPHWTFNYDGKQVTWLMPYNMLEFFVRKGGHIIEYAILTALVLLTLRGWGTSRSKAPLITFGIVLLYAAIDEWHQHYVPTRTGHAVDVLVDAIGIVFALTVYGFVQAAVTLKKKRSTYK